MRAGICLFLILLFCCNSVHAADDAVQNTSQIGQLQQYRNRAKLYVPAFVLTGQKASFRVFAFPYANINFVVDYGSYIEKQTYSQKANEKGVAIFSVPILDNEDLVGKSVAVDAYILDDNGHVLQHAIMQSEAGTPIQSNRVYIADKDSSKGFFFSPWQSLNSVIMSTDYEERSGYNPTNDQMYYDKTPVYIRNMRDAQDNVR